MLEDIAILFEEINKQCAKNPGLIRLKIEDFTKNNPFGLVEIYLYANNLVGKTEIRDPQKKATALFVNDVIIDLMKIQPDGLSKVMICLARTEDSAQEKALFAVIKKTKPLSFYQVDCLTRTKNTDTIAYILESMAATPDFLRYKQMIKEKLQRSLLPHELRTIKANISNPILQDVL